MWHEFASQQPYLDQLVHDISTALTDEINNQGRAGLAVSGGRSPIPLFHALSDAALPWDRIHIMLVDERFVSPGHPDSNEQLVRKHLLQNHARHAPFQGLVHDPAHLQDSLDRANLQHDPITVALLGMGDDGHTASLFSHAPQLAAGLDVQQTQRYLHMTPDQAPHERISMTLSALLGAGRIMVAISGEHKRRVMTQATRRADPALPISYVVTQEEVPVDIYWHK